MFKIAFCWFLVYLTALLFPNGSFLLNATSLILWLFTSLYIIYNYKMYSYFSFVFLWAFTFAGVCCFVIEFGTYLPETQVVTYLTGAITRNLALCFFFIYSSLFVFQFLEKSNLIDACLPRGINEIIKHIFVIAFLASALSLVYIYIKFGSPSDYNVDRFYYWENIAPGWGEYVRFILSQLSIFIGVFYVADKKNKYIYIFTLGLLSQVLVGEKFSGLFISLLLFCIPIFVATGANLAVLAYRYKKALLIVAFVFPILILTSYTAISGGASALTAMSIRLLLQGQMWWGVDSISSIYEPQSLDIIVSKYLGYGSEYVNQGMYFLMEKISPSSVFEQYSEAGVTFTMAAPVNNIYFFGFALSILPTVFIGMLSGVAFWFLYRTIVIQDYLLLLISMKFYFLTIRVATMGDVGYLFSLKTIAYLFIIVLYILMSKFKKT
ncbi:DUF6418 domain-containing protein [Serratia fonticola]|uniref:DUF6418 domain-containing protein n=1 Tax=Serratia fonticola TaxID=47917 RepID=UPI00301DD501